MCVCVFVYMCTCVHVYMCICVYVCMYICMYVCLFVCMDVCIFCVCWTTTSDMCDVALRLLFSAWYAHVHVPISTVSDDLCIVFDMHFVRL